MPDNSKCIPGNPRGKAFSQLVSQRHYDDPHYEHEFPNAGLQLPKYVHDVLNSEFGSQKNANDKMHDENEILQLDCLELTGVRPPRPGDKGSG